MSDQGFDQQPPAAPPQGAPVPPQYPSAPLDPSAPPAPQPAPTYPQQPTAPQSQPQYPPQPQPGYAPQPQPQPGGYAPQPGVPPYGAVPQPPAKKSKAGLIAGIIAALFLCGIISCGVLGAVIFKSDSGSKNSIAQAEQHFNAAMAQVETANTSIQGLGSKPSQSKVAGIVSETDAALRSARDEIAAAKSIADGWSDSQGKTDYQAGLTSANEALDSMQDLVAYLDTASGMAAKTKAAASQASQGMDALNAAVRAGNGNHYSAQRTKALAASAHFVKATLLFKEAHKLDTSADLDKAAHYCELRRRQASVVVRMASEGLAHRISAYNADVKRMNAASRAADKVGAAAVNDGSWAEKRLSTLGDAASAAAAKADELRSKALGELGYTK